MLNVICLISIVVNCGFKNIGCMVKSNVKGTIIEQSTTSYLVDFSEGLKLKENFSGDANEYKEVIIDAKQCIKLK